MGRSGFAITARLSPRSTTSSCYDTEPRRRRCPRDGARCAATNASPVADSISRAWSRRRQSRRGAVHVLGMGRTKTSAERNYRGLPILGMPLQRLHPGKPKSGTPTARRTTRPGAGRGNSHAPLSLPGRRDARGADRTHTRLRRMSPHPQRRFAWPDPAGFGVG